MSGIIGHMTYAMLGGLAARQRKLPIAPLIHRHYASYLAGAYLGCDVQTMPAATCVDTGQDVGYGSIRLDNSPLTGGPVKPWTLRFEEQEYTPRQVHAMFYGRSHLVFGWSEDDRQHVVPWDHLPDYLSMVVEDAMTLFAPGERQLAYLFGWSTHVVGDSLIKSVQPGIDLNLLNGKYTPENRPIQDLVSFHEVGRKELHVNWQNLMTDLAATPVEPIQLHYMRVAKSQGSLSESFPNAWWPEKARLLRVVLVENRRYQKVRNQRLLQQLELRRTPTGWDCDPQLSRRTGGLSYRQMTELADKAHFRHALWQMGEAVADLFERIVERQPRLQQLPSSPGPSWQEITQRWRRNSE